MNNVAIQKPASALRRTLKKKSEVSNKTKCKLWDVFDIDIKHIASEDTCENTSNIECVYNTKDEDGVKTSFRIHSTSYEQDYAYIVVNTARTGN